MTLAAQTQETMSGNLETAETEKPMDWLRFRGPNGEGRCPETDLLDSWPEGGPSLLWTLEGLGRGYSSITIADGRLLTMGDLKEGEDESQYVMAFDLKTRERLWTTKVGPKHNDGSRCTPTVDGDRVYAIGTNGDLVCVRAASGALVWRKHFERDFGGKMMSGWRYSESPLIDGDKLVCTPGGKEASIVALNKHTGEMIWQCGIPAIGDRGKDGAGYASVVVSEACNIRQYIQILGRGAVGVRASDGKFLWGYSRIANNVANIPNAIVRDNHVFVTTSYKTGSALLKLVPEGDGVRAEEVYFLGPDQFENHHGGVVLVDDYIYGGDGQNKGGPVCLEFLTGKIAWKENPPAGGSAATLYADGHIIFRYDKGPVYLIKASPEGFEIKGELMPPPGDGPAWAHPVIHDGTLYLRRHDRLVCYDVSNDGNEREPVAETGTPIEIDGAYQVRNKKHNTLLRPRNANSQDGTAIVLYSRQPWKCLSWQFKPGPHTSYQPINFFTNKTFQPTSTESNAEVIQVTAAQDAQEQFWQFVPIGNDLYKIVNLETGKVLTAYEKSNYEVVIRSSSWQDNDEQKWELLDLPELTM
jgi:outer membrane protein assembly factor BamB